MRRSGRGRGKKKREVRLELDGRNNSSPPVVPRSSAGGDTKSKAERRTYNSLWGLKGWGMEDTQYTRTLQTERLGRGFDG